ncbi:MAG: PEP-CTERM sorting domain-containing protein [Rariglobus sp.]|nr:PEP-CTERM sorting domain-containing protein [Rariglobus sp.]
MKTPRSRRFAHTLAALGALTAATPFTFAGAFLQTTAGPYEYTDTANWSGTLIGNNWTSNITANQTVTFATDYTIADQDAGGSGSTSTLSISNTGLFNHTFIGSGNRTLTLGGNITLGGSATNANTVTIGSTTDGQKLNVDLGGTSRNITTGGNRTLEIVNTLSGAGGIAAQGLGTLKLLGTNSFTGAFSFGGSSIASSVVEITKLANGAQDSSIGRSASGAGSIIFGGSNAGTLRYIGTGDTTDRLFSVGSAGGILDASGTGVDGAMKWVNTGSVSWSGTAATRLVTLTGSNTKDNAMLASFTDMGANKTSIYKTGTGRWILGGTNTTTSTTTNNTFTGNITIDAGTLELGASTAGGNGANVILNGGTFATGGFSEAFGTLALNGNATLDLGAGDSDLTFANSSAVVWGTSISLSIINYTENVDSIFFGVGGLDATQLAKITINGFGATLENGFLVAAVPEPSTYALLAGAGGLFLAATRRRRAL